VSGLLAQHFLVALDVRESIDIETFHFLVRYSYILATFCSQCWPMTGNLGSSSQSLSIFKSIFSSHLLGRPKCSSTSSGKTCSFCFTLVTSLDAFILHNYEHLTEYWRLTKTIQWINNERFEISTASVDLLTLASAAAVAMEMLCTRDLSSNAAKIDGARRRWR